SATSAFSASRRPRPRSDPPGSPPDGGECARLWAELLRVASADLSVDGELPPLPAFPGQEPRRSPERAPMESFTVGTETFSWTPFPPPPARGRDPGRSYRVFRGAGGRPGSPARSPRRPLVPEPLRTPRAEEQLPDELPSEGKRSVEGPSSLQSCPMCQADFTLPGLAQWVEDVAWIPHCCGCGVDRQL
uniref:UBZ2-type domain-containing protein n=1 Tax=Sus scrofa TaxID=9823 RepID=A0A8D0P173_PIG